MDLEEQKRVLRQKQAGFEAFHRFEVGEWRKATFADRLRDYADIMGFVEHLNRPVNRADDDVLANRWSDIRRRYDGRA